MIEPPVPAVSRRAVARALSVIVARCVTHFRQQGGERLDAPVGVAASLAPGSAPHYATSDVGLVIDVRARGAKGDGKTDDFPVIQSSIEEALNASGGTVFFPNGHYRVSEAIALPFGSTRHIRLRGDTRRGSVIVGSSHGQTVIRVGGRPGQSGTSSPVAYYGSIEDLTVAA